MSKKTNQKRHLYLYRSLTSCASILLSALAVAYLAANAHAGGAAFDPTYGGTRSGCYKSFDQADRNNYSIWNDTCFGASWREYTVGGDYYKNSNDTSEIAQWESDCTAVGANKYYRLGYERFNTFHSDNPAKYTARGEQKGFKRVNEISGHGGSVTFNTSGLSWSTVETIYNKGKDLANANPSDSKWDSFRSKEWSNVSGFCWNEEWENQTAESKFGAYSWVSTTSSAEKKTTSEDSTIADTITTDQEKVTVNFKHQLGYNPPADVTGKTFGAANTNYNVRVTKDGADVTSQANFTTANSGSADVNNNVFTANSSTWSPWLGQSSIEVDVPEGGSVKVCSKITYDPKIIGWKESSHNNFVKDDATTENRNKFSQACITIKRGEEETEDGGQINFWSSSKVQLNGSGDLPTGAWGESDDKDADDSKRTVTVKVSTDQNSINVNFSHKMYKSHTAKDGSPMTDSPDDVWPSDICTKYTVVNDKTGTVPGADGVEYCHPADPDTINAPNNYPATNIPTVQGQTVRVCSKISYEPRTITLTRTKKTAIPLEIVGYEPLTKIDELPDTVYTLISGDNYAEHPLKDADGNIIYQLFSPNGMPIVQIGENSDGSPIYNWTGPDNDWWGNPMAVRNEFNENIYVPIYKKYYEYSKDEELDNGWSEACIEVTKPDDPDLPPNAKGPYQGDNNAEFMYTGQDTPMDWELKAKNYETRRIVGYRNIIFQVNVLQNPTNGITKGNINNPPTLPRSTQDPCAWYSGKVQLRDSRCGEASGDNYGSNGFSESTTSWSVGDHAIFAVPDYVGDKYCNSAGIKWGYWYGRFGGTDGSVSGWQKYGSEYWTNYDAACRTIVKKPSVSLWNGGLFTNGKVTTSVASRYLNPQFNQRASSGKSNYGSWTEYLGVVWNDVEGFASGASLAYSGNGQVPFGILNVSPLTISNAGVAGRSQISSNTTLLDRINYYILSDKVATPIGNSLNGLTVTANTADNVKVLKASGTLEITNDIIAQGTSRSIYQLPQVVIYAPDGIKIASNVKRIDAWLITKGDVNTCSAFNENTVRAYVQDLGNTNENCAQQLTINGPIIAKNIKLNRTAGADPRNYNNNNPAGGSLSLDGNDTRRQTVTGEVFNLSADTYLWAYVQAGRYKSSYTEAYSRELPPRY